MIFNACWYAIEKLLNYSFIFPVIWCMKDFIYKNSLELITSYSFWNCYSVQSVHTWLRVAELLQLLPHYNKLTSVTHYLIPFLLEIHHFAAINQLSDEELTGLLKTGLAQFQYVHRPHKSCPLSFDSSINLLTLKSPVCYKKVRATCQSNL